MRPPSTLIWLVVHIVVPLLPFGLGGLLRWVAAWRFEWTNFSAAELAVSLGLLTIYMNQSLLASEQLLRRTEKEEARLATALAYVCVSAVSFALFALITTLGIVVNEQHFSRMKNPLVFFQTTVFVSAPLVIYFSVIAQRHFKLRASI